MSNHTAAPPGQKTADIAKRLVGQPYRGVHRRQESNPGLIATAAIFLVGAVAACAMAVIR